MSRKEAVLCIQRSALPSPWVTEKSVIKLDIKTFCNTCQTAGFEFRQRDQVESDPSLKQIIPYILFQTSDLRSTAVYKRSGSEKRLHDLWSLGIGGHINPQDGTNSSGSNPGGSQSMLEDFETILVAGMERELTEEIIYRPDDAVCEFIGMINEDITEVGSVHLGAVFRILTATPDVVKPGDELSDFQWMDTKQMSDLNLELWSRLVLELIS